MSKPTGERPIIRGARDEELEQVALVVLAAYQQYRDLFPKAEWEGYSRDIMDVRGRLGLSELIVAERAGRLVGAVTFYPSPPRPEQEGWPSGWSYVRLLAVHPDARGLGIGQDLMDECLRRSRQRSAPTLGLHTSEIMSVARGMYERMGFARAPELDFHPTPGTVVMAYRLDL